jgi:hypothetical protein
MIANANSRLRLAHAVALAALMAATAAAPAGAAPAQQPQTRLFSETGKQVAGQFLQYWEQNGGLAQQGFPISDEMQEKSATDGKTYTVQYFERAVFELHPENQPPYDVLLSLLGTQLYKEKYPAGAPGQSASKEAGTRLFAETGKTVGGAFLDYWEQHGGLAQQGYPISEEFTEVSDLDGKTYTVQYFERAVFELHPENTPPNNVLLSQLGTFRLRARNGQGSTDQPKQPGQDEQATGRGRVEKIRTMSVARACHTQTVLPNGKVLIAGGSARGGVNYSSAELFDPATGQFTRIANMSAERVCHEAVLLADGRVLIAGGSGGDGGKSAEIFDPAANTFTPTGSMNESRQEPFAAVLLPNGKVLVTGGYFGTLVSGAELYDPATGQFTKIGDMTAARANHTMTVLPDGKVLIAGGGIAEPDWGPMEVLSSAEIFDPATNTFTPTGSMAVNRYKHGAALLPNGKVLVVAGSDERQMQGLYAAAELYDPATGRFSPAGNLAVARYKILDSVVLLPDGRVLISGGAEAVEMYDPTASAFSRLEGGVDSGMYFFQVASLLPDGSVLMTGGNNSRFVSTSGAWLYRP